MDRTLTTPWRPQSDGMMERFNRTLGGMLRHFVSSQQDDWDKLLPLFALAYNSSIHSSTAYSPNFLMFGQDFRVPLGLVLPVPEEDWATDPLGVKYYVKRLEECCTLGYQVTRDNLQASAVVQKHYNNRKVKAVRFAVGQSVWLYNPRRKIRRTPKLDMPWEGPYAIVMVIGEILCEIQMNRRSRSKIVHVDKLRPFDMDWVFKLPRKKRELIPHMDLGGLSDNVRVENPVNQVPPAAETWQQVGQNDEIMDPGPTEVEDPAIHEAAGDEIMVPVSIEAEIPVLQGEKEKKYSSEQKTTRSGRKY